MRPESVFFLALLAGCSEYDLAGGGLEAYDPFDTATEPAAADTAVGSDTADTAMQDTGNPDPCYQDDLAYDVSPAARLIVDDSTPIVVCGPYEYAIGVDQMGRGLPEPPPSGGVSGDDMKKTGPSGPMHKETEVVG